KATTSAMAIGKPKASNGLISRWCTHGLVTAPRINVAAVIPSCAPASMMVSSFKERKPARDAREVSAVSSKRLRRALIKENSMMTKKAEALITSRVRSEEHTSEFQSRFDLV